MVSWGTFGDPSRVAGRRGGCGRAFIHLQGVWGASRRKFLKFTLQTVHSGAILAKNSSFLSEVFISRFFVPIWGFLGTFWALSPFKLGHFLPNGGGHGPLGRPLESAHGYTTREA